MDYKNGKIYKIVSDLTDKIYIGSTTQPLCKRHSIHRNNYKRFVNGKVGNISSFELVKLGKTDIILIEDFPCERKDQLHARERYYIDLNKSVCVNKNIPTRTQIEYRQQNKELIKERDKKYYQNNKDKKAAYNKVYRETHKQQKLQQVDTNKSN